MSYYHLPTKRCILIWNPFIYIWYYKLKKLAHKMKTLVWIKICSIERLDLLLLVWRSITKIKQFYTIWYLTHLPCRKSNAFKIWKMILFFFLTSMITWRASEIQLHIEKVQPLVYPVFFVYISKEARILKFKETSLCRLIFLPILNNRNSMA